MNPELLQTFLAESEEIVEALEQGLVELEGGDGGDTVHALFRAAHTLKGNAGMVGLQSYVRFTHVLENVLGQVRDGKLDPSAGAIEPLLVAVDVLRAMAAAAADGEPEGDVPNYAETLAALEEVLGDDKPEQVEAVTNVVRDLKVELKFLAPLERRGAEIATIVAELAPLGTIRDVTPPFESCPESCTLLLATDLRKGDVEGVVMFAGDVEITVAEANPKPVLPPPPKVKKAKAATKAQAETVRVDSLKLDGIVDLVGEIAIALSRVRQSQRGADAIEREDSIEALELVVRDLQERAMGLRLIPVRDMFERFRRPIRDLARDLGKEVEFETQGTETEIDRKLLDDIADPLKHMVRNALAHGVEAPDARVKAGKPRAGKLVLRASQRQGAAVIEIEDDGGGIDKARVFAKAVEKNLVSPNAKLTDAQVYDLMFAPGFSTAAVINEVSGRGVGLDVVKKAVQARRGTIQIVSELGKGTTFRIRLPTTLAVVDGLYVRVGAETMAIPMPSVAELLDTRTNAIRTLEGKSEYIDVRGEVLPIVRLGNLLDVADSDVSDGMVVVVQSDDRRFGLLVDRVVGMARAVLKPLERSHALFHKVDKSYTQAAGLGGATVLGDGSVGMVLDVPGLGAMAFGA